MIYDKMSLLPLIKTHNYIPVTPKIRNLQAIGLSTLGYQSFSFRNEVSSEWFVLFSISNTRCCMQWVGDPSRSKLQPRIQRRPASTSFWSQATNAPSPSTTIPQSTTFHSCIATQVVCAFGTWKLGNSARNTIRNPSIWAYPKPSAGKRPRQWRDEKQ